MAERYAGLVQVQPLGFVPWGPLVFARRKNCRGFHRQRRGLNSGGARHLEARLRLREVLVALPFADVPRITPLAGRIFGPLQSDIPLRGTRAEALDDAKCTAYEVGCSVWSPKRARQMRLAKRCVRDRCYVNNYGARRGELPLAVGLSGHGREKGSRRSMGSPTKNGCGVSRD